jgi:hypothetical protein
LGRGGRHGGLAVFDPRCGFASGDRFNLRGRFNAHGALSWIMRLM